MLVRYTVVFTMFSSDAPAAFKTALKFRMMQSVSLASVPLTSSPETGSSGICPAKNSSEPL